MRLSTALRVAGVIIIAKAVLIGVVYWRRAEILGRPVHIGADSWMITIIAIGLALAAGVYVAAHGTRSSGNLTLRPPATRSPRPRQRFRQSVPCSSAPHGYIQTPTAPHRNRSTRDIERQTPAHDAERPTGT